MMTRYIAIEGTHEDRDHRHQLWDDQFSPFSEFMASHGVNQLVSDPLKKYEWSTGLDGVFGADDTWDAAGRALAQYMYLPAPSATNIIAFSHGGNVVAYACGKYGLQVNSLVTVSTPIRKNLYPLYKDAETNITRHLHIHGGWADYWQALGDLCGGGWGLHRDNPYALNQRAPGGHGAVLKEGSLLHLWVDKGWLDYFISGNPLPILAHL